MNALLALAAPAAAAPARDPGRRKHRRTHGNGPGKSTEEPTIIAWESRINQLQEQVAVLEEGSERVELSKAGLSPSEVNLVFRTVANSRTSLSQTASFTGLDKQTLLRKVRRQVALYDRCASTWLFGSSRFRRTL